MADWPGRRRSRSRWIMEASSGRPGGTPSTTTPTAAPWDSPQVVTQKSFPNELDIGADVILPRVESLHGKRWRERAWVLSLAAVALGVAWGCARSPQPQ